MSKYFSVPINITKMTTDFGYPNYYPFNSNKLTGNNSTIASPFIIGEFEMFENYSTRISLDRSIFITNKQITPEQVKDFLSNIALYLLDPDPQIREFATILMSWKEEK